MRSPHRILVPLAMLGAIGAGSLVLQRWIAATITAAVVLSLVWAAAVAAATLVYAHRRPGLLGPVLASLVLAGVAASAGYWYFSVRDVVVDEDVVVATAAAEGDERAAALRGEDQARRRIPVEVARGSFTGEDGHSGAGTAAVIQLPGGGRSLTFTRFDVDPGVDVDVYLVPGDGSDVSDRVELGGLKGNVGDQQYEIPAGADLSRYSTVVLYCVPFTVRIAIAPLA